MFKMKRCPFCGGDAFLEEEQAPDIVSRKITTVYFGKCERCKACGAQNHIMEEAVKYWNDREIDKKVILVEDGSVDLDEVKELGFRPLVYRQGAVKPELFEEKGND